MRPYSKSFTPADDSTNGLATSVGGTSGVAIVQQNTDMGDSLAHLVIITPSGSITGSFVITGTNENGDALTETLATNTTNPVTSTNYFLTVTSVLAPAGIGAETVQIGWTDDVVSFWYPIDWPRTAAHDIYVDISGTIDYDIQQTFANVLAGVTPSWVAIAALDNKTGDTFGQASPGATAWRILINSLTAGATIKVQTSQPSTNF